MSEHIKDEHDIDFGDPAFAHYKDDLYDLFSFHHGVAERIFQCVNACAGMQDPEREIQRLRESNEKLVNALKQAMQIWDDLYSNRADSEEREAWSLANAAIKTSESE